MSLPSLHKVWQCSKVLPLVADTPEKRRCFWLEETGEKHTFVVDKVVFFLEVCTRNRNYFCVWERRNCRAHFSRNNKLPATWTGRCVFSLLCVVNNQMIICQTEQQVVVKMLGKSLTMEPKQSQTLQLCCWGGMGLFDWKSLFVIGQGSLDNRLWKLSLVFLCCRKECVISQSNKWVSSFSRISCFPGFRISMRIITCEPDYIGGQRFRSWGVFWSKFSEKWSD